MATLSRKLAVAALSAAFCAASAWAQAPDKTPTPQQQRMVECNKSAGDKKGDERKAYMSACLKGELSASGKPLTPQQQRMKECNAQAGAQSLSGDKRKAFMSSCLKS